MLARHDTSFAFGPLFQTQTNNNIWDPACLFLKKKNKFFFWPIIGGGEEEICGRLSIKWGDGFLEMVFQKWFSSLGYADFYY